MLEWVLRAADQVDRIARSDPEYRELAQQRSALDSAYNGILDRFSEEDRELLLEYMDIVGNMQYRITQLAWRYGTLHPHD